MKNAIFGVATTTTTTSSVVIIVVGICIIKKWEIKIVRKLNIKNIKQLLICLDNDRF